MIGTLTLSFTYQWLARVRDAPFGPREVRDLLIVRGIGGFFGGEQTQIMTLLTTRLQIM